MYTLEWHIWHLVQAPHWYSGEWKIILPRVKIPTTFRQLFKDPVVMCMLDHLHSRRKTISFCISYHENKSTVPSSFLQILVAACYTPQNTSQALILNEVRCCQLWKDPRAGKGSAADPGYSVRSPDTWVAWFGSTYITGDVVAGDDEVWDLWQAPEEKSQIQILIWIKIIAFNQRK